MKNEEKKNQPRGIGIEESCVDTQVENRLRFASEPALDIDLESEVIAARSGVERAHESRRGSKKVYAG